MIKFDNIQIKYGDFIAIDNLNLEINEGEFFTFLGPSGCGKSTTCGASPCISIRTKNSLS